MFFVIQYVNCLPYHFYIQSSRASDNNTMYLVHWNPKEEKIEDIKGVIRSRNSKKDKQYNG